MKRFKGFLSLFVVTCIAFLCLMSTSVFAATAGDFTITGSTSGYSYDSSNHLLTISGSGEYKISGSSSSDTIKVTSSGAVTLTLAGVSIESSSAPPIELTGTGAVTVKLSGTNTLTSTHSDYAGLHLSTANLTITSADGDDKIIGNLAATGGINAAGIGSGKEGEITSSITINGGTITATGGTTYGAGIGRGYGDIEKDYHGGVIATNNELSGNITITGGAVTATGGTYCAGIGSSHYSTLSGSITITGGTVTATGGGYGAGIGSSYYSTLSGNITITGGTVTCNTHNGAGIGTGWEGDLSGSIIISGGTIIATSDDSAAGIGTGVGGDMSGSISITGGDVTGSSMHGSGIGAGIECTFSGSINISGGIVSGTATKDGSGIGVGKRGTLSGSINLSGGYMTFSSLNASAIGTAVDSSTTESASINITGGYFSDSSYTVGEYGTGKVYGCGVADGYVVYANTSVGTKNEYPCYVSCLHSYTNGFCGNCGGYQPATLNGSGIYEISNAGQLFWFASLINGDTTQEGITAAVPSANAVLTGSIDLSVTTSTHTSTEWTPIGSESVPFSGTFDGDGYTVSGMSITTAEDYVGLFGYVTGTVKNMTVDGSINVTSSGGIGVGGIVGCVYAGTLSHLTSTVNITGYDDTKGNYAGIVGSAMGDNNTAGSTVEECVYSGELTASGNLDCIGGIVGYINAATINNCANFGTVDTTGGTSGGIYTGGILGYCNNTSAVIKNSYNYGTVEGAGSYIGAVVGRINTNIGGLSNCYYLSGTASAGYGANAASIDPNSNIAVKTAEEFASGEVAWLLQNANNNYVWGQHITGSTTDAYPIIKSNAGNEEDRVVCIEFYKLSNTIPYAYRYTNVDKTIAEYPGDGTYKFYRYSDLTGEIDTTTTTFTDNDCLYMYAQRDLIISKTNGDEAIEDAEYTYENNILTIIEGSEYTIEMNTGVTSTTDTIKVDTSDDVTITLAGVSITSEYGSGKAPFEIAEGGNVTVKLSGENTLTSESSGNAGLQLTNANLIITSADGDGEITGSLEAAGDSTYSAGIGSGYYKDFGSIIINGGTITATGSTFGAGIGGASRGSGSITINGGNVSASSRAGAGIGGGTTNSIITITGGTVDASSNSGAAIGGGQGSEGTVTVNISGGYITVSINNSDADYIGSGTYSSSTDTVTITGGYFGSGSAADETVYDVTAAAGYSVFNNNDTATNGTYPVYVEAAYTVAQSLTNVTSSNTDTKVITGGSYSTTLTGTDCYVLPDSITVTAGGTELTAGTDYTYNSSTGELTISNVTGNIVITAAAANTSHSYDSGEVTTKATCTTDGVMTYTCKVCGDTYTEVIPATGHTTEIQNAKAATCTENGYTGDTVCTVCGETITTGQVISAKGHSYDSGVVTAEASCTTDGVMTYTCTVCAVIPIQK